VAVASTGRIYVYSYGELRGRGYRLALTAFTASGNLDPAFNGGRPVSVYTNPVNDPECCSINGLNPTPDGGVELSNGFFETFTVQRYTATGRRAWQTSVEDWGAADAALSDGSVRGLGADVFSDPTTPVPFSLVGLTPSGRPDTAVGPGGKRALNLMTGPSALVADSLDRLYVVGNAWASLSGPEGPTGRSIVLTRLSSSGAVDASYGKNGTTEIRVPEGDGSPGRRDAVALGTDGSLLIAGTSASPATGQPIVVVRRIDPTGTFDTGFGIGGVLEIGGSSGSQREDPIALAGNGRLVASYLDNSTTVQPTLGRLDLTTGALDPPFGRGGAVPVAGFVMDLAVTADGKLITVSRLARDGRYVLFVARRTM
jgi:uncharacterized delta-60 repeat protein